MDQDFLNHIISMSKKDNWAYITLFNLKSDTCITLPFRFSLPVKIMKYFEIQIPKNNKFTYD